MNCKIDVTSHSVRLMPCVVLTDAPDSLTNRKQNGIAPTILYTPTAEGTFRINVYISATGGGTGQSQWDIFVRWKDRIGERHAGLPASNNISDAPFGTFVVHDLAGQPLEYRTSAYPERGQAPRAY